jgi:hypothetical protein
MVIGQNPGMEDTGQTAIGNLEDGVMYGYQGIGPVDDKNIS